MNIRLSYSEFESFVGDVRPLWLISDENLKFKSISWSLVGDAIEMKNCGGCGHGNFSYGVFLTFVKEGEAEVSATYDGVTYTCLVKSHKRDEYTDGELNYYKADLHTHTTPEHRHDKYIARHDFLPKDYLFAIADENELDVAVMTDHATTMDLENFFKNFTEYELMRESMNPLVYPGCENEIYYTEPDRFGRTQRLSGELITLNAASFCLSYTFPEFFRIFKDEKFAIGILAHPHVVGISTKGIWDYKLRQNNSKEFRSLIKYVEAINYPVADDNLLNEYAYSDALDGGFRVSTTLGSDIHKEWDFSAFPGATVIMAKNKTREAITDALLNLRAYASESGNIKLKYSVNGMTAPCDLAPANKYHFKVNVGYFAPDEATRPTRCEVISDGGRVIKVIEGVNFDEFEFDIESDSARWFYLRFVDSKTYRTFSPPVFTGREPIPYLTDSLVPIDKKDFSAWDECGNDAGTLFDGCAETEWCASGTSFEITVDMKKSYTVRALGNYAALIDIKKLRAEGVHPNFSEARLPLDYEIYTSLDGSSFKLADKGLFRSFSGEEIVTFEPTKARFIKLSVTSTTGSRLGRGELAKLPARLSEITIFE